jgi:pseudaminic acid biosynthesis-associated methylase
MINRPNKFKTEQEAFWADEFGNEYTARSNTPELVSYNIGFFATALRRAHGIHSIAEFGANVGLNMRAFRELLPGASLTAVEINKTAAVELEKLEYVKIHNESILDVDLKTTFDLTMSKGVLIHINPDFVEVMYEKLYSHSNKFILIAEYYNPVPVEVNYRGHKERLYKRDFAGEMLTRYPELRLLDYGFVYHRDAMFPGDDFNWFLLEKNK